MRSEMAILATLVLASALGPALGQSATTAPSGGETQAGQSTANDDPLDQSNWRERIAAARARHAQWLACVAARLPGCSPADAEEPAADDPMERLFNDETLVPGDVVSTTRGLRVFRGQPSVPHSWADFQ